MVQTTFHVNNNSQKITSTAVNSLDQKIWSNFRHLQVCLLTNAFTFISTCYKPILKLSSFSCSEILPILLRSLQQLIVIIHLVKTLAGIYHTEFTQVSLFKLVSHFQGLLNLLLAFFLSHADLFTCQHSFLHDNLILVDPFLLALGA